VGLAYDPVGHAGALSFEPQNGASPAVVYVHGLLWNGAKFDLLGRRFAITVNRRLPLLDSSIVVWEHGAKTPLLEVSGRQGKAEALRLAQNVTLDGTRYAVLQGPMAARDEGGARVDRSRRFVMVWRLREKGKLGLAASAPWDPKRPWRPTVALTTSADGKQLILTRRPADRP
jgi:hypothetical protein